MSGALTVYRPSMFKSLGALPVFWLRIVIRIERDRHGKRGSVPGFPSTQGSVGIMRILSRYLISVSLIFLIGASLTSNAWGQTHDKLTGFEAVLEALRQSGLQTKGTQPTAMDLDGNGEPEYVGRTRTNRKYSGKRLSAFYIVGKPEDEYKVMYKLIGNFSITHESLIDFNRDGVQDYYFRYGKEGTDYGYILLWNRITSFKSIYRKRAPHLFYPSDLNKDGVYELVQIVPPFSGPQNNGVVPEWQWKDVLKWNEKKEAFVKSNHRYAKYYENLKPEYESVLKQIESEDVPGYEWTSFDLSFLELRERIETDYMERIGQITKKQE